MKKLDIARAWRDEDYFLSLTEAERASLPANPAAGITLADAALTVVNGGVKTVALSCRGTSACTPCPGVLCSA